MAGEPHALGLLELALSAACAASVRAAASLGLPDVLGEDGASAAELAAAVGADEDALRRLLRSLSCYQVFTVDGQGRYRHTETSRLLREDNPDSLKHLVLWCTEPWTWTLWGHLDESVRTGTDVFTDLHGREFFEHLHVAWPQSAEIFDVAMTQSSKLSATAIAGLLDLSDVDTVADVAGGQGHLLATLLEHNPGLHGVLLDLPDVVANADDRLRAGGALADRVTLVAADARAEIPVHAGVYLFKNILGLGDEDAVRVLRNTARAAQPGARAIVVENFVDDGPGQKFSTAMDLRMLLSVGGRKHTKDGLLAIVERAGLIVHDVRPVNSYQHMIEATVPE